MLNSKYSLEIMGAICGHVTCVLLARVIAGENLRQAAVIKCGV